MVDWGNKEVKWLAQGHTVSQWLAPHWNPGSSWLPVLCSNQKTTQPPYPCTCQNRKYKKECFCVGILKMFLVSLTVSEKRGGGQNIPSFQFFPNAHLSFNIVCVCVCARALEKTRTEMMNSDLSITSINWCFANDKIVKWKILHHLKKLLKVL